MPDEGVLRGDRVARRSDPIHELIVQTRRPFEPSVRKVGCQAVQPCMVQRERLETPTMPGSAVQSQPQLALDAVLQVRYAGVDFKPRHSVAQQFGTVAPHPLQCEQLAGQTGDGPSRPLRDAENDILRQHPS